MLEIGPITRNWAIGCGSPWIIRRWVSGRMASARNWPQAMKNCCSGVKPSRVAAEVADALAQDELAVVVDARLDEVVLELVDDALAAGVELVEVVLGPPVVE